MRGRGSGEKLSPRKTKAQEVQMIGPRSQSGEGRAGLRVGCLGSLLRSRCLRFQQGLRRTSLVVASFGPGKTKTSLDVAGQQSSSLSVLY